MASVPWARPGGRHPRVLEDTVAWMATRTCKSTLEVLLRIAWRTVGAIVARVVAEGVAARDPLPGLRRIGIDEISYKKGHRYITIVVDHDTGRLVWAAPGRDRKTLNTFFTALGESRCAAVTHVSADAAQWIADEVALNCPNAVRCADAFHIVAWAGDALDQVRLDTWNAARHGGISRPRPRPEGRPLRAVEEPREPHQPAAGQAGLGREGQPSAVPGLPAQRATPGGLRPQGRGRQTATGLLARLGPALSHPELRPPRPTDQQAPRGDRRDPGPPTVQRAGRIHQYQAPALDPDRFRLQEPRGHDRPRHAQPRRVLPTPTRPSSRMNRPTEPAGEPQIS